MKKKIAALNETELNILQLLWTENRPLSRPEILEKAFSPDRNRQTIHRFLNSMIEKGVLTVDGSVLCGKIYGRTYAPTITRDEYISAQIDKLIPDTSPRKRLLGLMSSLIDEEFVDEEVISELEKLLETKRKELHQE